MAETIAGLDAMDPQAAWRAMQRAVRNLGREGTCRDRDIRSRCGAVRFEGANSRICHLQRCLELIATRLRYTAAADSPVIPTTNSRVNSSGWVARDGCALRQDESRHRSRRRSATRCRCQSRDWRCDAVCRCQWRLLVSSRLSRSRTVSRTRMLPGSRSRFRPTICVGCERSASGRRSGMDIAAGEYAYTIDYVREMLAADAVDVQQADVTRCGGVTALLADRRCLRGVPYRSVRTLRAGPASARRLRGPAVAPSRMVS